MSEEESTERSNFEVGDIVRESSLIIPPDRDVWNGIVVHVDKDRYNLYSELGPFEDMIYVHWFRAGYIESLPASVIVLVQKAKEKS